MRLRVSTNNRLAFLTRPQQQQQQQQQQRKPRKPLAPELGPAPKPLRASATTAAGRSRSQEHSRAEAEGGYAEGASLAGHAICKLELLSWGCSSGHRGVCSLRKADRAEGCAHVVETLGGAAEGSYEQEAAVVEEDEEMEREDGRGVAKLSGRPHRARCAGRPARR
jgi:hypothetical protein